MNTTIANVLQIILAVILVVLVLLQSKQSGLSTVFGGGSFQTTKRGPEKALYYITIGLITVFCLFSIYRIFL